MAIIRIPISNEPVPQKTYKSLVQKSPAIFVFGDIFNAEGKWEKRVILPKHEMSAVFEAVSKYLKGDRK